MSKYIQILNNLSHDEKLIIDSEIQTKAMSKFNFTLLQIPFLSLIFNS